MKQANIVLIAIAALLLITTTINTIAFFQPNAESATNASLAGTYVMTFYAESAVSEEIKVAERYNQELRRIVLMEDGRYFMLLGGQAKAGKWVFDGKTLSLGSDSYEITTIPGGFIMNPSSFLTIAAFRQ